MSIVELLFECGWNDQKLHLFEVILLNTVVTLQSINSANLANSSSGLNQHELRTDPDFSLHVELLAFQVSCA
jgi:hypothetical protein